MRILWCDRDFPVNTPSFQQMRSELSNKMKNNITFKYATGKRDMLKVCSGFDVIIIGPFVSDLDAWENLGKISIPKIMIVSDPQSDIAHHVYYTKKYKINMLLFLYPAWIPVYQKYLECKMDVLPWWLNDPKENIEKQVDLAYAVANSPFHPVRWLVSNDKRIQEMNKVKVPFGIGDSRIEWNDYIHLLNRTKLLIFDGSFWNLPILKYVEGMATECCILAPSPEREDILHLKPYENYVPVTIDNYFEQIVKYLDNNEERECVAKNARETFLKYNTTKIRMDELLQKLELLVNE